MYGTHMWGYLYARVECSPLDALNNFTILKDTIGSILMVLF